MQCHDNLRYYALYLAPFVFFGGSLAPFFKNDPGVFFRKHNLYEEISNYSSVHSGKHEAEALKTISWLMIGCTTYKVDLIYVTARQTFDHITYPLVCKEKTYWLVGTRANNDRRGKITTGTQVIWSAPAQSSQATYRTGIPKLAKHGTKQEKETSYLGLCSLVGADARGLLNKKTKTN